MTPPQRRRRARRPPATRSRQAAVCRRGRSGSCSEFPWSRRVPRSPPAFVPLCVPSYPPLETFKGDPESFAHVLVALPDLRNEGGPRRMLAQDRADLVEIDLAFADLQTFAVEPLGITKVQTRGVRAKLRQALRKSEAEMVGGKLGVRDIDAHAQ